VWVAPSLQPDWRYPEYPWKSSLPAITDCYSPDTHLHHEDGLSRFPNAAFPANGTELVLVRAGKPTNRTELVLVCAEKPTNRTELVLVCAGKPTNRTELVLVCARKPTNRTELVLTWDERGDPPLQDDAQRRATSIPTGNRSAGQPSRLTALENAYRSVMPPT